METPYPQPVAVSTGMLNISSRIELIRRAMASLEFNPGLSIEKWIYDQATIPFQKAGCGVGISMEMGPLGRLLDLVHLPVAKEYSLRLRTGLFTMRGNPQEVESCTRR